VRDSADAGIGLIVQGCIMAVAYRQVRILPGGRINPSGRTAALTAISPFCTRRYRTYIAALYDR
jgi:hypothetical protein